MESQKASNNEQISLVNNVVSNMNLPFAILIIAIVFMFVFKKQIGEFLERLKEFKAGKNGIEANALPKEVSVIESKKEAQISESVYEEEAKQESRKESHKQPETLDDWRKKMFLSCLLDKDKIKLDEAYEHLKHLDTDPLSLKKDNIVYLRLSHQLGDTSALEKIKEFLNDSEVAYLAAISIGHCYKYSDDLKNAGLFYRQALIISGNDDDKSLAGTQLATVLYRDSEKEKAIDTLMNILTEVNATEPKIRLYSELADIYDQEKDYESKAFVIDKAIELKPNDTTLLFKAGYSYAESEFHELSLLHYKNASNINPDDESIQNNLGVQYDKLKMPIRSIESYRKAEKLGNTLASANLAYRLLQTGFVEEAKLILKLAQEKTEVHQNVSAAISEIHEKIELETETEKEEIKSALSLRKFILEFAEAKFAKDASLSLASGNWLMDNKVNIHIEVSNKKIIATWKRKFTLSFDIEFEHKFEGDIFNNSSKIEFYEKNSRTNTYEKKNQGFLFINKATGLIKYLEIDKHNKSKSIHTLTKVV